METDKFNVLLLGSGFIGSILLDQLVRSGYRVKLVSRQLPAGLSQQTQAFQMEMEKALEQNEIWEDPEYVIYTIHHDRPSDRIYDPEKDIDLKLMQAVLEKLNGSNCKKFIYLSSGGAVYGVPETAQVTETHRRTPVSAYGESKKRIEDLLVENSKNATFETLILRPSNVYGDQHPQKITGIVNHMILAAIKKNDFTIWGDGKGSKGYLHAEDLSKLILLALQRENQSGVEIFNVCSEEFYTPAQLLELLKELGYELNYAFEKQKQFDVCQIRLSSEKAQKTFNWKPTHSLKDYILAHLNNA